MNRPSIPSGPIKLDPTKAYTRAYLESFLEDNDILDISVWLRRAYGENKEVNPNHCLIRDHEGYLVHTPPRGKRRMGTPYRARLLGSDILDYIENALVKGLKEGTPLVDLPSTPVKAKPPVAPPKKRSKRKKPTKVVVEAQGELVIPPAGDEVEDVFPSPPAYDDDIKVTWSLIHSVQSEMRDGFSQINEALRSSKEDTTYLRGTVDNALAILGGVQADQQAVRQNVSELSRALQTLGHNSSRAMASHSESVRDAMAFLGGFTAGEGGETAIWECWGDKEDPQACDDGPLEEIFPDAVSEVSPPPSAPSPSNGVGPVVESVVEDSGDPSSTIKGLMRFFKIENPEMLISIVLGSRAKRTDMVAFLQAAGVSLPSGTKQSEALVDCVARQVKILANPQEGA